MESLYLYISARNFHMHSLHHGILSLHFMIVYICHRTVQFTAVVNIVNMAGAGYQHYHVFVVTLNIASTSQICTSAILLPTLSENLKIMNLGWTPVSRHVRHCPFVLNLKHANFHGSMDRHVITFHTLQGYEIIWKQTCCTVIL